MRYGKRSQKDSTVEIIPDIFEKMIKLEEDEFIRSLLEDIMNSCSKHGFKYSKGNIVQIINKKSFLIPLHEDPAESLRDFRLYVRKKKLNMEKELVVAENVKISKHNDNKWKTLKTSQSQNRYIHIYADRLERQYKLTHAQNEQLRQLLFRERANGLINAKNIDYAHEGIKEIRGLYWDPIGLTFSFKSMD